MIKREKVFRADNQQERLINIGWVVGFVDGEGCFSINFIKQPERIEIKRIRRGYKTGYQIAHEFAVTQGLKSLKSLIKMRKFFGVGSLYLNKRYDNHNEHLYRYVVRKREDLLKVIIPFFQEHKLQTAKRKDFEKFVQCISLIEKKMHLTPKGVERIALITEQMNRRKSKQKLIRILRNQTPAPIKRRR